MRSVVILAGTITIIGIVYMAAKSGALNTRKCPEFTQGRLQVGRQVFSIGYARTSEEKARGLGNCPQVPPDSGLYFPFEQSAPRTFWMKNMLTSIDIIWIQDDTVIGIEKSVPPPDSSTPDHELPRYHSPAPADAVLEITAGASDQLGLKVGDSVKPL